MEMAQNLCKECEALGYCKKMHFLVELKNKNIRTEYEMEKGERAKGNVTEKIMSKRQRELQAKLMNEISDITRAIARDLGCKYTHLY